ncbi:J domain-containing protein [bacterium]|nr:J domain-containing protein [bacterium]
MPKGMKIATALEHLGLTNQAGAEDVKQAYRELVKIWHPDRFQNDERLGARTEAQLKVINEAKTVALDYVEKYGHFRHVTETTGASQTGRQPPRSRSYKEEEPDKEEPEPEPAPKKPEAPKPPKIKMPTEFDLDFDFNLNVIIGTIVTLGLVGFLYLMSSSFLLEPAQKVKAFQNQTGLDIIQARADKKSGDRKKRIKEAAALAEAAKVEPVMIDTFFTLGSNKQWVSFVQGPPFQIQGAEWRYGFSSIQFEGGKVVGWNSSELNPLKIGMLLDSIWILPSRYFTTGSFVQEVINLQGAPDVILGNRWSYGEAFVQFDADTVIYWENDESNRLYAR